jgi:hypothetical protein
MCESQQGFGWGIAHAAVSRRPPISLYTSVARTRMYTYAPSVWDSSIVQPFSVVAPCQTPFVRFATPLLPPRAELVPLSNRSTIERTQALQTALRDAMLGLNAADVRPTLAGDGAKVQLQR